MYNWRGRHTSDHTYHTNPMFITSCVSHSIIHTTGSCCASDAGGSPASPSPRAYNGVVELKVSVLLKLYCDVNSKLGILSTDLPFVVQDRIKQNTEKPMIRNATKICTLRKNTSTFRRNVIVVLLNQDQSRTALSSAFLYIIKMNYGCVLKTKFLTFGPFWSLGKLGS